MRIVEIDALDERRRRLIKLFDEREEKMTALDNKLNEAILFISNGHSTIIRTNIADLINNCETFNVKNTKLFVNALKADIDNLIAEIDKAIEDNYDNSTLLSLLRFIAIKTCDFKEKIRHVPHNLEKKAAITGKTYKRFETMLKKKCPEMFDGKIKN